MMSLRNLSYLLATVPGLAAIFGNITGGYWSLTAVVFSLVVLGGLEWITGSDTNNAHSSSRDSFPEAILLLLVLIQTCVWASLAWGLYSGILSGSWRFWAAVSSGVAGGAGGIVPAHELIHKASALKRWLGKYLLTSCGNVYFYIHHLRIHHRYVGTENDAATARKNESLYAFVLRTMRGQFSEAWQSEAGMLSRKGIGAWSLQNQVLRNLLWQAVIVGSVLWVFGMAGLLVWLTYAVTAHVLLEYVNYIEHYGLHREEADRVNEQHSWNSDSRISRYLLVDLSRHADHHYYASKPFHTLQTYGNAPTLPGGYAALLLPALVPPLWKALVHPRLDEWEKNMERIKP